MFLVSDGQSGIERRVRDWFLREPSVGLVVAAVYFEWTISRAIICLSKSPNVDLRKVIEKTYGLGSYEKLWAREVSSGPLASVVRNWQGLKDAFNERNILVHGRDRRTSKMAAPHLEALLAGAADVWTYCTLAGYDLGARLPVRRK